MARQPVQQTGFTLLLCMIALVSCGRSEPAHQQIIENDLLAILQQLEADCPAIDGYTYTRRHQYEIVCTNQRSFRIEVDAEGKTQVISLD